MATFPYADMPTVVEARFDGLTWTDLSARLTDEPIQTREGRSPGAQRSPASSASLVLDNDDGDLSPLNPMSAYYPNIQLGLAMRIRQQWFADTFTRTQSDTWGSDWTNTGGSSTEYDVNGTAGTHTHGTVNQLHHSLATPAVATADAAATVSWSAVATGATYTSWVVLGTDTSNYYAALLEWTTSSGVRLVIYKRVAGALTALTAALPIGSYIVDGHWSSRLQVLPAGRVRAKVWAGDLDDEPDEWAALVEDSTFTSFPKIGVLSRREPGNTNSNAVASWHDVRANHDIYQGEVGAWDPDFIPTTDGAGEELSVVRIQLAGIGQRLQKPNKVLRSPMNASMSGVSPGDYTPDVYLPLEDGEDATTFASGLANGTPVAILSGVTPAADDTLLGSLPVPTIAAGAVQRIPLPLLTDTGRWHVVLFMKIPSAPSALTTYAAVSVYGGGAGRIEFAINPGSPTIWQSRVYDPAGVLLETTSLLTPSSELTTPGDAYGNWFTVVLGLRDGGGGEFDDFGHVGFPFHPGGGGGGDNTGAPGRPIDISLYGADAGVSVAHVALFTSADYNPLTDSNTNLEAIVGWTGEQAHERVERVGRENAIPVTIIGESSAPMGPQPIGTLFDVLGECEDAAQAVFGESGSGLGFTCLSARYNTPAALTVDLSTYRTDSPASRQVLAPKFNDQGLITKATAQRVNGSEATVDSGTTPEYEEEASYNVEGDDQLPHLAAWRVHMGQRIAMRYPGTPLNIGENLTLASGWMLATRALGLGRIIRTSVPTKHGYVDIDEMVDGWSQTLRRRSWTVTYDGTPAALLTAVEFDDDAARYSSRSTTTAEALDKTETGIDIVTETGRPPWITGNSAPVFPHDIEIGGEQIRVTASTSTGTYTRTLTVQRSINGVVKSHASGAAVRLYQPAFWAY